MNTLEHAFETMSTLEISRYRLIQFVLLVHMTANAQARTLDLFTFFVRVYKLFRLLAQTGVLDRECVVKDTM